MPSFTTFDDAQAELVATCDYDVEGDVAKAKRFVAAARAMLFFASSSGQAGATQAFDMQRIEGQLKQALAFVDANGSPTEAQQLANPSVTHADFSTFRGYQ